MMILNCHKNFSKITGDEEIVAQYDRIRIFLDEDYECLEKFTALGSLYLVHSSVKDVKLYNFQTANFDVIGGQYIDHILLQDKLERCY